MPRKALGFDAENDGGAIVMQEDDHALTRTYGWRGALTKSSDAGLSFRTVLAKETRDLQVIGQSQYGDPSYYNQGIRSLLTCYRSIGRP